MTTNDPLFSLREALKFSPDNIPLRQHIADTLLNRGEAAAAAIEYQQALTLAPTNIDLKLGLARAYYQEEKDSAALVIIEDLLDRGETSATILTLHARLLMRSGDLHTAAQQFRQAISQDPIAAVSNQRSAVSFEKLMLLWFQHLDMSQPPWRLL